MKTNYLEKKKKKKKQQVPVRRQHCWLIKIHKPEAAYEIFFATDR